MLEPDCFLRYRIIAGTRNFTSGKSDVYVFAAAATRGFTMVLFSEPSKHFCRRYVRYTECRCKLYVIVVSTSRHFVGRNRELLRRKRNCRISEIQLT